jgi:hypothetical protein
MQYSFIACLLVACGGASTASATVRHDDIAAVTTSPVASSPPLFTGAFEVESMTDGKQTVTIADLMKKANVTDGRLTWEIGADKFKIGTWTLGGFSKLDPSDPDGTTFAMFCRASGEVAAHWEGSTFVLASPIAAESEGAVVRVHRSTQNGSTSRTKVTRTGDCNASFASTRIDFEIVEKDDTGPTKVRGKAPGVTVTFVRGQPIGSIDPAKISKSD